MPNCLATLDSTFGALSDPTRRAIIARLAQGPATVSELSEPFDMAMPSLLLHIKKLERAGLVTSKKTGRVRTCSAALGPLNEATQWMRSQQALWQRRLDRLEAFLDENP
jgi:DNA-binding transcriptional ArsR family regulator